VGNAKRHFSGFCYRVSELYVEYRNSIRGKHEKSTPNDVLWPSNFLKSWERANISNNTDQKWQLRCSGQCKTFFRVLLQSFGTLWGVLKLYTGKTWKKHSEWCLMAFLPSNKLRKGKWKLQHWSEMANKLH